MNSKEARAYLDSFENYEYRLNKITSNSFNLGRIKYLLNLIGNPQNHLKIIHIAGSKGKGSTSVMTAHILEEAGYRVGLYTSPHIQNCRERIRILDRNVSQKKLADIFPDMISRPSRAKLVSLIRPAIEKARKRKEMGALTWFEVYTAIAFKYFYESQVDIVILEAGLGGRLDATNVANALISVITPMSLEHTDLLGKTISKIAQEKAAIIKSSQTLAIIAPQNRIALQTICRQCKRVKAKYLDVAANTKVKLQSKGLNNQEFSISTEDGKYPNIELPLLGDQQVINAATVVCVVESLNRFGFNISKKNIYDGFRKVFWPLRSEIIQRRPIIILDCAHSPAAAIALVKTFQEYFPGKRTKTILGFSQDKDIKTICQEINKIASEIIFTRANNRRAADLTSKELAQYFKKQPVFKTDNVKTAIKLATKSLRKDDILLITGSNFVASEARAICINIKI